LAGNIRRGLGNIGSNQLLTAQQAKLVIVYQSRSERDLENVHYIAAVGRVLWRFWFMKRKQFKTWTGSVNFGQDRVPFAERWTLLVFEDIFY
jgi:hypothetical protein